MLQPLPSPPPHTHPRTCFGSRCTGTACAALPLPRGCCSHATASHTHTHTRTLFGSRCTGTACAAPPPPRGCCSQATAPPPPHTPTFFGSRCTGIACAAPPPPRGCCRHATAPPPHTHTHAPDLEVGALEQPAQHLPRLGAAVAYDGLAQLAGAHVLGHVAAHQHAAGSASASSRQGAVGSSRQLLGWGPCP